ncbi:hypothetical protein R69927_04287 [Paraburkholderia domus]|uniref:Uncharacterized protein n=1 Tax=Paraburkholderia domus TaxID=2793075 RepID=A0A9N8N794_9BURK|nr:hypothetical protein R75483_05765 [Paraburkholderia domus]CAE6865264.1 hypothetical protein R69749_05720 [Paraburkholderia domus]CAE6881668.1 hypothetical protein R69927_04287 [Paraburkholderia domus]CAE6921493.1 hypothetical protein R70199_04913 [Paraburkholderia domus]CAE6942901.1 hypothetical protein R75471_05460 [Paraburkholderia domus]
METRSPAATVTAPSSTVARVASFPVYPNATAPYVNETTHDRFL